MFSEKLTPSQIEEKSFEIISQTLGPHNFEPEVAAVVKRCIHTTADFDYAKNLYFSPNIISLIISAIKEGADIVTDTTMVQSGINKKKLAQFGGQTHCFIADPTVAEEAVRRGQTRSYVSMERIKNINRPVIVAVGNAPTALFSLRDLMAGNTVQIKAIIAVPVGFVNVVESKQMVIDQNWPAIVARGNKGGSNVAAAIVNACLYQVDGEK